MMIQEKNYTKTMTETVVPYLKQRETDGFIKGYDGNRIHYISYAADLPSAVVVILHGFTESCRKFDELSYYFLKAGFSVCIPDHRGHGESYRTLSDLTLTHIDRFEEYVDDFELLMKAVAAKSGSLPLFLFAHSMGGAVGTLYMERHTGVFQKAVLSSPMVAPSGGRIPLFIGRGIAGGFRLLGRGKERVFFSGEYPGLERFEDSCAASEVRFAYYEQKRRTTDYLQNYSPSYSWVYESIGVKKKILKKGAPEGIETEIILFSAEQENVVLTKPQKALAKRLRHARFIEVKGAKHEIFLSGDRVLAGYLTTIFRFFGAGEFS